MSNQVGVFRKDLTPIDRLKDTTVGRWELINDLLEKLASATRKKGGQHYLFIGPRGIGKTHFLSLIEDAVTQNKALKAGYLVIRFPEENNRLLSFADFLLGVIEIMGESLMDEEWQKLYRSLRIQEDDTQIIDIIEPKLRGFYKQTNIKLLILIENLDVIFTQQIKREKDVHQFRRFLMDTPCATLVGTAPVYFPALYSTKSPLYDFFDIQTLEDLDEGQTIEMIRKNLEWEQHGTLLSKFEELTPKIQALHTMTGGNPRLIIMLYDLIAHENLLDVQLQFQKLLDQISPFYQDRLKELAPQERALLETIALMRTQPRTPAAISRLFRKSPQQTSSLLKRMTKAGYLTVSENPADKRSKLYRIKEGFFDLWLAMSESRLQRNRLPYLVGFFEIYYKNQQEREAKRRALWEKLQNKNGAPPQTENCEKQLAYLSDVGDVEEQTQTKLELAFHKIKQDDRPGAKIYLNEAKSIMPKRSSFIWMTDQAMQWLSKEDEAKDITTWFDGMIDYWRVQRSGDLEKAVDAALQLGNDLSGEGLHLLNIELLKNNLQQTRDGSKKVILLFRIAKSQKMNGQLDAALASLQEAQNCCREIGDKAGEGATLNNISQIFKARGDYDTALDYLKKSLAIQQEIGDKSGEGATLNNISQIFKARGDYDTALDYLKKSLAIQQEIGDKFGEGATLNNISQIFKARGDYDTALDYLKKSLAIQQEIGDKSGEGTTLNNMATTAHARGDYDTALDYLKKSLAIQQEIGDKSGEGTTLNNMATNAHARGDYETALDYLKTSLAIRQEIGDKSGLCTTLFNMGHIHWQNDKPKEAMSAWVTVYDIAKKIKLAQVLEALENLAEHLELPGGMNGWETLRDKMKNQE